MPPTSRRAGIALLAAAQAAAAGCVLPDPGTSAKHDTIRLDFDPPETVVSAGDTLAVRSMVGEAWRVTDDSVRMRVWEATAPDDAAVPELIGRVVTVGRDQVGSVLVLDRDSSAELMAGAVVFWVVVSLLGLRWIFSQGAGG